MSHIASVSVESESGFDDVDDEHEPLQTTVSRLRPNRFWLASLGILLGVCGVIASIRAVQAKSDETVNDPQFENKAKVNDCTAIGGIPHPLGKKCCAAACGKYCGSQVCHLGPGSYKACCSTPVKERCDVTQLAPCMLGGDKKTRDAKKCLTKKTFTGLIGLGFDENGREAFVQSPHLKGIVAAAMADAFKVDVQAVTITGISTSVLRRLSAARFSLTVGYKMEAVSPNPIDAKSITKATDDLKKALQRASDHEGVAVQVELVDLPLPSVLKACAE